MGLIDESISAVKRGLSKAMPSASTPGAPLPTITPSVEVAGPQTAQAARAAGAVSPEAAAFNASRSAAPVVAGAAPVAAKAGLASRAIGALGNASKLAKVGGAVQGGRAAKNMVDNGVGLDNATDLISGAAKFGGPAAIVGSTALDVGKGIGKSSLMPDSVARGLAKAANYVTGNGYRNNTESSLTPNWGEINRVAAEHPGGRTAALLNGNNLAPPDVQIPATSAGVQAPAPQERFALPNENKVFSQGANAQADMPDGVGMIRNNQTGGTTLLNRGVATKLATGANGQLTANGQRSVALPTNYDRGQMMRDASGNGDMVPVDQASVQSSGQGANPQPSRFEQAIDRLMNQPQRRQLSRSTEASQYQAPPQLDFSPVAGDGTGIGMMGKIAAQQPAVAAWAAGMKRAKGIDTQNQAYDMLNSQNETNDRTLQAQGLGKAADIFSTQAQRAHERDLAMNKLAYDRDVAVQQRILTQRDANEKRVGEQMDKDFGPSTWKDGKDQNPDRTSAEKQMRAVLGPSNRVPGDLRPEQYLELKDAIKTGAAGDKSWTENFIQKVMGGSGATTDNAIKATTTTGERGPAGVGEQTADGRIKSASTLNHGGWFGIGGNQEAIERSRRENETALAAKVRARAEANRQKIEGYN